PFNQLSQVILHQGLLLFAALGFVLTLTVGSKAPPGFRQMSSRLLLLTFALIQATYLFFITIPRYNLTIMPILLMLSAAGIVALVGSFKTKENRLPSLAVAGVLILFFAAERLSSIPVPQSSVI